MHAFTSPFGRTGKCSVDGCGKTRNAKVHKAAAAALEHDTGMSADEADTAIAEAEIAAEEAPKPAKKAPAKKAAATSLPTIKLWVGWRISNAAVLQDTTLATKLRDAKPNSELDRFVHLTAAELETLDAIAATFQAAGNIGPAVYSATTLRRRIGEARSALATEA